MNESQIKKELRFFIDEFYKSKNTKKRNAL